jgi:hypothetical protein
MLSKDNRDGQRCVSPLLIGGCRASEKGTTPESGGENSDPRQASACNHANQRFDIRCKLVPLFRVLYHPDACADERSAPLDGLALLPGREALCRRVI